VGFDGESAYFYVDIRFKSEGKGRPVGPKDLCIAAVVMQRTALYRRRPDCYPPEQEY
jgi:predicted nucleic acid-binding protein